MKNQLLIILSVLSITFSYSQTFNDGVLEYIITDNINNYVSVGKYNDVCPAGNLTIPETIENAGVNYSVTGIIEDGFSYCYNLNNIYLPDSIINIGNGAFQWCRSLTSFTIPNSVISIGNNAFNSCDILTDIEIPNSVTNIGGGAFSSTAITSIVIPDSVTMINYSTFSSCDYLSNVTIPNSVTSIGAGVFEYCNNLVSITIPNSVTSIGIAAFSNCRNLESINLPNSISILERTLFRNCEKLKNVVIPDSVTSIGNGAFSRTGITSIIISESVTSIGIGAFGSCEELKDIHIPNSVTIIERDAFSSYNIENVNVNWETPLPLGVGSDVFGSGDTYDINLIVPEGTEAVYKAAEVWKDFNIIEKCGLGTTLLNSETFIIDSLEYTVIDSENNYVSVRKTTCPTGTLTIPENIEYLCTSYTVTDIGDDAFLSCDALLNVKIPSSVTSIGNGAFYNCINLINVNIPNSVSDIETNTFRNCENLNTVVIPNSVTSIEEYAFLGCIGLENLTVNWETPLVLSTDSDIFNGVNTADVNLLVPEGTESNYEIVEVWETFNIKEKCNTALLESDTFLKDALEYKVIDAENYLVSIINYDCTAATINIPVSVEYFCTTYTIISIEDNVFSFCSVLTDITIPNSIINIGAYAFSNSAITSITIPNSVTIIFEGTFSGCISLTDVTLPESVTSIGEKAFYDCKNLNNINIPNSVSILEGKTFRNCESLTNIVIPNSVTRINNTVFAFTGLTNIVLPESLEIIGNGVFYGCSNLANIFIPNSVTSIDRYAFGACTGLENITVNIETPLTISVVDEIFTGVNTANVNLFVPGGTESTYESAAVWQDFNITRQCKPALLEAETFKIDSLEYTVIDPDNNYVSIKKNICPIGDLNIPELVDYFCTIYTITEIADYAFFNCEEIASVVIPKTVTSIGNSAFAFCSSLNGITLNSMNPLSIDSYVFYDVDINNINLIIPSGSLSAYQTSSIWQEFLVQESLSTNDLSIEKNIDFYPNPVTDILNIKLKNGLDFKHVNIYNVQGAHILSTKELQIETSYLKSGIYFVEIETSQGRATKKVIVE